MESNSPLAHRYAVPVILKISRGKIKVSDLSDIVKSFRTLENLLKSLSEANLIIISVVDRPYRTTFVEATDLGYRVAVELQRAEDILAGITPEPPMNFSTPEKQGDTVNR